MVQKNHNLETKNQYNGAIVTSRKEKCFVFLYMAYEYGTKKEWKIEWKMVMCITRLLKTNSLDFFNFVDPYINR